MKYEIGSFLISYKFQMAIVKREIFLGASRAEINQRTNVHVISV